MRGSAIESAIHDLFEVFLDDCDLGPDEADVSEQVEREVQEYLDRNLDDDVSEALERSNGLEAAIDQLRRELLEEMERRSWKMKCRTWRARRVEKWNRVRSAVMRKFRRKGNGNGQ